MDNSNKNISEFFTIFDMFRVLLSNKIKIIIITLLFFLTSIFYTSLMTPYYISQAVYEVVSDEQTESAMSKAQQIGQGFGISIPSLGSKSADKGTLAIEIILSRGFVKSLMEDDYIVAAIMAPSSFSWDENRLYFDDLIYNSKDNIWTRSVSKPFDSKPSYLEVYEEYIQMLSIRQDKRSGFVYISVEHMSPIFAKYFIDIVIQKVNDLIRNQAMQESSAALDYLFKKQRTIKEQGTLLSINSLIANYMAKNVLSNIRENYVLNAIDAPYVPLVKSKPFRSLIVLISTILGFVFSITFIFIREFTKKN